MSLPNEPLLHSLSGYRAFLAQAPLCVVAFAAVAFILDLPRQEVSHWKTKFRRIDFLGAFVLVGAVFTLMLGLDRGSNVSWSSTITIVSLCISLAMFVAFVMVELKLAPEPFAPGRIIFERSLIACYGCNFFGFAGWFVVLFYMPLYFQAVDQYSATKAGLCLFPGIIASVSGSLFGGVVMQKTGRYYWLTVSAYTTLTLASVVVILCTGLIANDLYGISIGLAAGGFGIGIGVTATLIGLLSNASLEDQAVATACSYLFRSLGSVVGVSLAATVFQQSLRTQLRDRLKAGKEADNIVKNVRESLDFIKTLEPHVQKIVRECYGASTRNSFVLALGLVFFAGVSSCKSNCDDGGEQANDIYQGS